MADLGYISRKIDGAIDKILCENLNKRSRKLPAGRYVSLCFDDFPQSAAQNAAPMIEKRGWRATWYVAGGFMSQSEPLYGQMFNAADLGRLRRNGHDFGCHTFDHIDCRKANVELMADQAERSKIFLTQHGIHDVASFAFPFGAADLSAKRLLADSGLALRGVKPGINRGTLDLNMLKACGLQDNEGGTARAQREIATLTEQSGWLIIFTHDVRDAHSPWGVTPDQYADLLDQIDASGAEVVTVGDMVRRLEHDDIGIDRQVA